ncbi:flagellar export protein FliJ [Izhakiella capsodis]|uniref:Flagellar export protein FliJ n=1 Tax=Izhakiella capsodis TaxID=1367852 RepID=A0A1I4YBJ8_9GAMM|nr:hypothetical protein [Izhakiella capsodis]SFN35382.1 flagellar export protein FliJ [Izhakiella capsodis]
MSGKNNNVRLLERLRQLKENSVDRLSSELASQQLTALRYRNNIDALNQLKTVSLPAPGGGKMMQNAADYKAMLQRVVDWQEQEHALTQVEIVQLKRVLYEKSREEMRMAQAVKLQRQQLQMSEARQQQRQTDDIALQSWLRKQK